MGMKLEYRWVKEYPHRFSVKYNRIYDSQKENFNRAAEMDDWCRANISGPYTVKWDCEDQRSVWMEVTYAFLHDADATAFKLRWGGV